MDKELDSNKEIKKPQRQTRKKAEKKIKKDDTNVQYELQFDNSSTQQSVEIKKNVSKGELLEYRIKRLFFFMGYYVTNNIFIQTSQDEPFDVITDLDVYGVYVHNDFREKRIWADCKSGAANELSRISWLIGIKDLINVDDIMFVKRGVKLSTKIFANQRNIQIVDLEMLGEIEKRYEIEQDDWRSLWNPEINKRNLEIFKKISIPDSQSCKRILKFYNTYYWTSDTYAKLKKSITALRDLAMLSQYPINNDEQIAVRWMIYKIISLFVLAVIEICKGVFYLKDCDKSTIIVEGLTFGNMPRKRMEDILKVTNHLAKKIVESASAESGINMPDVQLTPPEYTEALIDFIFRVISNPRSYCDILRFSEFCFMQYDMCDKEYDFKEIEKIFPDYEAQISAEKTIVHFVSHILKLPKDFFMLLK